MSQQLHANTMNRNGFTLIELVLVVAVLAIVATVAVGKFNDIKRNAARKAGLASVVNIQRAINTAIASSDSVKNMFDYAESLLDVSSSGSWTGSEGTYDWTKNDVGAIPGVYCGIKEVGVVYNANGVTTGTTTTLEEARKNNTGINSRLLGNCGVYYLKQAEVQALNDAGVTRVLLHNYSSKQAYGPNGLIQQTGFASENNLQFRNGGPGMRPDMSAFYPSILTNGSPVVVLNPKNATDIYRAFGISYNLTKELSDSLTGDPEEYFTKGVCPRLVLFGLGRTTDLTGKLFETPPRYDGLDKTEYRNYILVFSMLNGTGNTGSKVTFAGVLTPEGNTAKGQTYSVDWAN